MDQLKIGDIVIKSGEPKKIYRLKDIDIAKSQILLEHVQPGQNIRYIWRNIEDYKKIKI